MKSAIITGAGSGIGKATALRFAKEGYHVFLLGRDIQKLQETQKLCAHGTVLATDLTQSSEAQKAVQSILSSGHQVEVLVNNAGTFVYKPFDQTTEDDWMGQFSIHILAAQRLTQGLWNHFVKNKKGSVINVSSTLGVRPSANTGAYSSMKAAQINWTQSLALEGAPHNIRVNAVSPGIVDTPIHTRDAIAQMHGAQPLGRVGKPEEIAEAIYFLASEKSAWTTGANLHVDGGINLA